MVIIEDLWDQQPEITNVEDFQMAMLRICQKYLGQPVKETLCNQIKQDVLQLLRRVMEANANYPPITLDVFYFSEERQASLLFSIPGRTNLSVEEVYDLITNRRYYE